MARLKDGTVVNRMEFMDGKIRVEVLAMDVGPKTATQILDTNENFRSMNESRAQFYTQQMADGEWKLNGDTIVLDSRGNLKNGQHRLRGVVDSGKTIRMLVVRGVQPDGDKTIDTGRKRSVADYLRHNGETSCTALAAALRLIYAYEMGKRGDQLKCQFTVKMAESTLKAHPEIRNWISIMYRSKLRISISMMAAAMYLMSLKNKKLANRFYEAVIYGENLDKSDPIWKFRQRCLENADKPYTLRHSSIYTMALLIKAWNAWRTGETPKSLTWYQTGPRAEPFPSIK